MKKILSKALIIASLMFLSAPSLAENVTVSGVPTSFIVSGQTMITETGTITFTSLQMMIDGLFYYSSTLSPSVVNSIDLSRRTQGGVVTFRASEFNEIIYSY